MKLIRSSSSPILILVILAFLGAGCKASKKKAEAAAAEKARMEQEAKAKQQLADEQKAREAKDAADAEARSAAEARAREAKASTPAMKLNQYFNEISSAPNPSSANSSISEALSLFESPDTPLLIIISQEGDQKDYDKPTTIKAYLNYLKDQKKNINKIESLEFNSAGKINSIELKK